MKKPSIFCLLTTLGFLGVSSFAHALGGGNQGPNQPIPPPVPTLTVNTSADAVNTLDGKCSLREAIQQINECAVGNIIGFAPSVTLITLSSSLPSITKDLTIYGPSVTIEGDDTFQLMNINAPSKTVTIDGLTMKKGKSANMGGAIEVNAGVFNLRNSTLTSNFATGIGGGLVVNGNTKLVIENSTIDNNTANSGSGGGVAYLSTDQASSITNSTISSNKSRANAGGLFSGGTGVLNLFNVTITKNTADFDQDGAGDGGGISNVSNLKIKHSIVADNFDLSPGATVLNCLNSGTMTSLGYNLENVADCGFTQSTDKSNVPDTKIDPVLQNNGGVTMTHALFAGSSAIDSGGDCLDANGGSLTVDQRGVSRFNTCDIGAFELNTCGDGKVDTSPVEGCDDGNTADSDGCSAACVVESGFDCTPDANGKSVCATISPTGTTSGSGSGSSSTTSGSGTGSGGDGGGGCSLSSVNQVAGQWPVVAIAIASLGSAMIFRRRAK